MYNRSRERAARTRPPERAAEHRPLQARGRIPRQLRKRTGDPRKGSFPPKMPELTIWSSYILLGTLYCNWRASVKCLKNKRESMPSMAGDHRHGGFRPALVAPAVFADGTLIEYTESRSLQQPASSRFCKCCETAACTRC